jgi:DNA-binding YbaB/EbfC family protein
MGEGESSPTGGFGDLFSQLQAAQAELEAQTEAIEAIVVEGSAAGGAVVVRLSGALEAESVHIDPSIIDPDDPALLEDAVLAALRDGLGRIVELKATLQEQAEQPFSSGMDLSSIMGNLDFGGLLGGVDVNSLMADLGMGVDLSALGGSFESQDDDHENDEDGRDAAPEA